MSNTELATQQDVTSIVSEGTPSEGIDQTVSDYVRYLTTPVEGDDKADKARLSEYRKVKRVHLAPEDIATDDQIKAVNVYHVLASLRLAQDEIDTATQNRMYTAAMLYHVVKVRDLIGATGEGKVWKSQKDYFASVGYSESMGTAVKNALYAAVRYGALPGTDEWTYATQNRTGKATKALKAGVDQGSDPLTVPATDEDRTRLAGEIAAWREETAKRKAEQAASTQTRSARLASERETRAAAKPEDTAKSDAFTLLGTLGDLLLAVTESDFESLRAASVKTFDEAETKRANAAAVAAKEAAAQHDKDVTAAAGK